MCHLSKAVGRKLVRSLEERGIGGTALRMVGKPLEWAYYSLLRLTPANRRYAVEEQEFDRRFRVQTCVRFEAAATADIESPNWKHDTGYAPAPIQDIRRILAGLEIDHQEYVFIDIGAGKGRMLFLAAERPFKQIVGVEFAPALFKALEQNIESYHNPERRCFDVSAQLQDAAEFNFPHEPLVLLFHHPFGEPVMRQVLDRVEQSLHESPREVWIIYYDPHCPELFDERDWLVRRREGKRDPRLLRSDDWIVYGPSKALARAIIHHRGSTCR